VGAISDAQAVQNVMNASPLQCAFRGASGSGAIVPDCGDRVLSASAPEANAERLMGNGPGPRLLPIVLSAAMVIAPFAAWLFAPEAGLAVETEAAIHPWLRLAMAADLLLAAACLGVLVWLLMHR
jgi:hypothetical protein